MDQPQQLDDSTEFVTQSTNENEERYFLEEDLIGNGKNADIDTRLDNKNDDEDQNVMNQNEMVANGDENVIYPNDPTGLDDLQENLNNNEEDQVNEVDADADADAEDDDDEDSDDSDEDGVNIVISDIVNKPYLAQSPVIGSAAQTANLLAKQKPKTATATSTLLANNLNQNMLKTAGFTAATQAKGVDLEAAGMIGDVPTYDFDIQDIKDEDKPWRKPGADITDYFNYGFTEDTWIGYCAKQKRQRAENNMLKASSMMPPGPLSSPPPGLINQPPPTMVVVPNFPPNVGSLQPPPGVQVNSGATLQPSIIQAPPPSNTNPVTQNVPPTSQPPPRMPPGQYHTRFPPPSSQPGQMPGSQPQQPPPGQFPPGQVQPLMQPPSQQQQQQPPPRKMPDDPTRRPMPSHQMFPGQDSNENQNLPL